MPMPGGAGSVPMAVSRPAVSGPTMPARVAAAVLRIPHGDHFGIGGSGCCLGVLPSRVHAVPGGAMAAGEGTEQG